LPVIIFLTDIVPNPVKGSTIIFIVIGTIALSVIEKIPKKELGIRVDNIKKSALPYALFTILAVFSLLILSKLLNKQPLANWWTYPSLQWVFLPISFIQEFVFRAFFQTKLQKILNPTLAIALAAFLFASIHILWRDPLILLLALLGGLGWGYLWYKYPNLWLITISHAAVNFTIIFLGFFPWTVTDFFKF